MIHTPASRLRVPIVLALALAHVGIGWADDDGTAPPPKPTTTGDATIPLDQLRVLVKPLTREELVVEAKGWQALLRAKAGQIAAAQVGVKKTNEALGTAGEDAAAARRAVEEAGAPDGDGPPADNANPGEDGGVNGIPGDADDPDAAGDDAAPADDGGNDEPAGAAPVDGVDPDDEVEAVVGEATRKKEQLLEDVTTLREQQTAIIDRFEIVLDSLEAKGGDVEEQRRYAAVLGGLDVDVSDAAAAWSLLKGWIVSREGGQRWLWNLAKFGGLLLLAWFAARIVGSFAGHAVGRTRGMSQLAKNLIVSTARNAMLAVGFVVALAALEVDIAPLLAAIGAAGFIVGFALQGTLSNFASGLMILLNRPFDVGDVVTAGGVTGKIAEMNLVSTTFLTFDNQSILVPNNEIWDNVITNVTAKSTRRVDLVFGVGYDDDLQKAEEIIREVVEAHELVLADPEPIIRVNELGDSSVNFICRPWSKTADYWTVYWDITRRVKERFDEAGVSIPFPQRDVHVHQIAPQ